MFGSILFSSFAEDAVKDRELSYETFVFNSSENRSNFYFFEKRFYRQQFSFVIILIFMLTEQFENVCHRVRDR